MKKVLLTSGYKHFLKSNTSLLAKRGLGIFSTGRGAEALNLHEEHNFDLIISDFKLEDMGGCTFCSLIREKEYSHHVPIVLTCYDSPGRVDTVELSGANIIMLKPVDPIKLMNTIGSFIDFKIGRSKRVVLEVGVFGHTGEVEFFCFSHDISNTGILIETKHPLDLGDRIICKFTLPGICQIVTKGEISRNMNVLGGYYLYGVKFFDMPLSHRRAIDIYINSIPNPESSAQRVINRHDSKQAQQNHSVYSAQ